MGQEQVRFNLPQLLLVFLLVVAAVVYVGPAILNRDPLWFRPFNETPSKIIVYRDGRQLVLTADDPRFQSMTKALNDALSTIQTIDVLGPSAGTIEDYRAQDLAVEVLYPGPVQFKSSQNVGKASAVFIPLTGRHTERPRFYTGAVSSDPGVPATYGAGTPVVRDWNELRQMVDGLQF